MIPEKYPNYDGALRFKEQVHRIPHKILDPALTNGNHGIIITSSSINFLQTKITDTLLWQNRFFRACDHRFVRVKKVKGTFSWAQRPKGSKEQFYNFFDSMLKDDDPRMGYAIHKIGVLRDENGKTIEVCDLTCPDTVESCPTFIGSLQYLRILSKGKISDKINMTKWRALDPTNRLWAKSYYFGDKIYMSLWDANSKHYTILPETHIVSKLLLETKATEFLAEKLATCPEDLNLRGIHKYTERGTKIANDLKKILSERSFKKRNRSRPRINLDEKRTCRSWKKSNVLLNVKTVRFK